MSDQYDLGWNDAIGEVILLLLSRPGEERHDLAREVERLKRGAK